MEGRGGQMRLDSRKIYRGDSGGIEAIEAWLVPGA